MSLAKPLNLALRGLQWLWTILVMALIGNIIANAKGGNPSIINYDMFVAVFAFLSLIYLTLATVNESFTIHAAFPFIVDLLNVLFWFCGAVATAAKLGVHSCNNNDYLRTNGVVNGAVDKSKRCTEAQASCAFLFFGFAAFAASALFSGLSMGGGGANLRPSRVRGPNMSQV